MAEHEHEAEPDSPSSMDQELAKETGKMTVLEIKEEYTYVIPSLSKEKKTLVDSKRVPSGLLLPTVSFRPAGHYYLEKDHLQLKLSEVFTEKVISVYFT